MSIIVICDTGADESTATVTESVDGIPDDLVVEVVPSEPQPKSATEAANTNAIFMQLTLPTQPDRSLNE